MRRYKRKCTWIHFKKLSQYTLNHSYLQSSRICSLKLLPQIRGSVSDIVFHNSQTSWTDPYDVFHKSFSTSIKTLPCLTYCVAPWVTILISPFRYPSLDNTNKINLCCPNLRTNIQIFPPSSPNRIWTPEQKNLVVPFQGTDCDSQTEGSEIWV